MISGFFNTVRKGEHRIIYLDIEILCCLTYFNLFFFLPYLPEDNRGGRSTPSNYLCNFGHVCQ